MNSILNGRPALKKEVDKIAEVAGYLWQNGWAERNGGNITVNITDLVDDEIKALPSERPKNWLYHKAPAKAQNTRLLPHTSFFR